MTSMTFDLSLLDDVNAWNARRSRFPGARVDLAGANLTGRRLDGADLSDADLRGACLAGTGLRGADLTGADLRRAVLTDAVLDGARLDGAKLWGSRRDRWSIIGVSCNAAAWDEAGSSPLPYEAGLFERHHRTSLTFRVAAEGDDLPVSADEWQYVAATIAGEGGLVLTFDAAGATLRASPGGAADPAAETVRALQKRIEGLIEQRREQEAERAQLSERLLATLLKRGLLDDADVGRLVERTVLATDIKSFSRLDRDGQTRAAATLDGVGALLFDRHGAEYANDWGDALVAVFVSPNDAIAAAIDLVAHMKAAGLSIRVGLASGMLRRVRKAVQGKAGFEGEPLVESARLEPMADPGEVIAGSSIAHAPELDRRRFVLTPVQRAWTKPFGTVKAGDPAHVFHVAAASE